MCNLAREVFYGLPGRPRFFATTALVKMLLSISILENYSGILFNMAAVPISMYLNLSGLAFNLL